jgi:hypothetical protein
MEGMSVDDMTMSRSDASLQYERIEGGVSAALVFAAAAAEAYQTGSKAFGDVCFADAVEEYDNAINRLADMNLPCRERHVLEMKINQLRNLLEGSRSHHVPVQHQAA